MSFKGKVQNMYTEEEILLKKDTLISYVSSFFPEHIRSACKNYLSAYSNISEVRMRLSSPLSFTLPDRNLITGIKCSSEDIAYCIDKMTESNYIRFEDMIRSGYITLKNGCRAGVGGDVFVQNSKIKILRSISSVNIRLPSVFTVENKELMSYLEKNNHSKSVLVISPPGVGKTTVLKNIAYRLSTPPVSKRVAVVDTKNELYFDGAATLSDYFTGYPKAEGIMIAATYFNPEYIICDEIGESSEAEAISSLQHIGVPLIASAHAESFFDVKLRKNLNIMLENCVFDAIMRLYRVGNTVRNEIRSVNEIFK